MKAGLSALSFRLFLRVLRNSGFEVQSCLMNSTKSSRAKSSRSALPASVTRSPVSIGMFSNRRQRQQLQSSSILKRAFSSPPIESATSLRPTGPSKQVMRIDIFGNDFPNADVTVKGITFREGSISSTVFTGAGLYVRTRHADIVVEGCTFYANRARHHFNDPNCGGCYVRADGSGKAVVRNCRFLDNYADIFGGGLYAVGNGTLVVENCIFLRNDAWRGNCSTV